VKKKKINKYGSNLSKNFSNSDPSAPIQQTMAGIFSISTTNFFLPCYLPSLMTARFPKNLLLMAL